MTLSSHMTRFERRVAILLAAIFSTRMLGLFMILPVFSLYAQDIQGYTPFLVGLALGIYGLTQALLQIPLGLLSDRIGRKPVIIFGLVLFAIGSMVAAVSDSMWGIIIGRALQGAGAIASAVMALAADLTREEHRTKVMALIGISIGASFALAMVIGPLLHSWWSLSGIFWVTTGLAAISMAIVWFRIPNPQVRRFHRDAEVELGWLGKTLRDPQLVRLDLSIFILHFILMASFVVLPLQLNQQLAGGSVQHWQVYLPVLLLSMLMVMPFILVSEKKNKIKQSLMISVGVIIFSELGFFQFGESLAPLVLFMWLFFTGFNLLEASLPSLVSRVAPVAHKGTAMGAYSTSQFLGVFFGGTLGGWVMNYWGAESVFILNAGMAMFWLAIMVKMPEPEYLSSYMLNVGMMSDAQAGELAEQLSSVEGVAEALVIAREGIAYLKVDVKQLDEEALSGYSVSGVEQV